MSPFYLQTAWTGCVFLLVRLYPHLTPVDREDIENAVVDWCLVNEAQMKHSRCGNHLNIYKSGEQLA